ncbi:MAG: hypothetical protein LC620_08325, partial [Halobacteriales archaeon]|nr:hypothetical protein [Halobacteriales archaeon]
MRKVIVSNGKHPYAPWKDMKKELLAGRWKGVKLKLGEMSKDAVPDVVWNITKMEEHTWYPKDDPPTAPMLVGFKA